MKNMIFLVAITTMISMWSCSDGPTHKEGEVYNGFKLIENRFVEEVNANCLYFEHEKSGARLIKIATDDANKVFAVSFKTLPQHDYGTPHIIEHSVLNGSENFPAKSPFDILRKGSLNTFLNAMTGSDFTTYPIASMNNKDYFNLMHVYMDAVFNPLLHTDPRILKQEGWHYELDDVDDEITYKGVVYNEMKGAYSDPERQMDYYSYKMLFPDNTYGVSSGGYPEAIPDLTYEYFKNFHKTYYHPSNSFVLLYGDADLDKELEFLDRAYFSKYEKQEKKLEIPIQEPLAEKKTIEKSYSVPEGTDTIDKTFLGYYFVAGLNTNQELTMALDILSEALVNHESAPLRLAIQEAGIGKDIYSYVDDSKQNVLQINVQNANPEDKEKFEEVVSNTLKKVAQEGFEEEMIEGIVNRMEFRLREGDTSYKGLMYLFSLKNSVLFSDDIFDGIEFEKPLANVKEGIKTGMLQKIVQDYMIDNPHALMMVFKPQPGLENEMAAKTKAKLAEYKASLSDEELQKLVEETKALKEYQQAEDAPEAVATIPMLSLSDISKDVQWYEVAEKSVDDIPVLHFEDFTNDIIYANFFFDLRTLPSELIPYANLMSQLLGKMNTENYDFGELDNALNIHTGGFYTYLNSYLENDSDEKLIPKLRITTKATIDKTGKLFELLDEILNNTKFDDTERLKELLVRHHSQVESQAKNYGIGVAMNRLTSYFKNSGMFNEITNGLTYYDFVTDLTENFDSKNEEIIANLQKVASLLFTKQNMVAGITCSSDNYTTYQSAFSEFLAELPNEEVSMNQWVFDLEPKNEGLMSSSLVQYVTKGYDFKKLGYEWDGKMEVLNQVLSTDYLQTQIRVMGGAYGGWAQVSPSGTLMFASYRDPNLTETLENFDAGAEYLKTFEADSTEMTRYIIGTISNLDYPTTASQRGTIAMSNYFKKETKEKLQKERNAVLNTTAEDISSYADMISDVMSQNIICVYGNDQKIKENQELFYDVRQVVQ
ncbi:insulinase family protein [Marinilabilia sp.]|uniref:insulinase family protein n=1 Tax=Marinilabilia sp. TaxID=2021252 RepID=UPI0025C56F69|nr:insulinase family protein [Marinilabilia sp.]